MKVLLMNNKTSSGSKSPQCKVCGDESSGFHYGVDSCEGCKGFFRRCITQGMSHKCANEEKCEMTPFTRNSCQYCRLKKCFEVGMSREASRLGRRPKRMKDVSGESSRSHSNLPIAPYPSQQELQRLRMAELQKLLQANGTFKSELMQAFLSAAQHSFREHSKSGGNSNGNNTTTSASSVANTAFGSPPLSSPPLSASVLAADMNLNTNPSIMSSPTNLNLGPDLLNPDSCSPLQVPSPFQDLTSADLSPLPAGLNLNMQVYAPNSQSLTDNMPSPVILPPNDNMDPCSPSEFLISNTNSMASLGTSPSPRNVNINNLGSLGGGDCLTTTSASPTMENLNINTNFQGAQNKIPTVMVKQEPASLFEGFTTIKQEPVEKASSEGSNTTTKVKSEGRSHCLSILALPNTLSNVAEVLKEVKLSPNDSRRLLIHQVTDVIVDSHLGTTINTYANVAQAKERIGATKNVSPGEMPDMAKLSLNPQHLWGQFLSSLIPEITKVVKFSKKLPGFCEISKSDQIKLIKQGTFEVMVSRFCVLVDDEKELMLDPKLSMLSPRHVIQSMPMGKFLDEFFFIAKKFNPLHLTDGEIGLFTSILMMCPDRDGLEDRNPVQKIQELFLQALYFLMKHNHSDVDQTFMTLIGLIPDFRKVNDDHAKFLNNIKMSEPSEFERQFPGLHQEVFDSDSSHE